MKLVTLSHAGGPAVGCVEQQDVVVLPAPPSGQGLVGWLQQPAAQLAQAAAQARATPANVVRLSDAKLLPALPRPGKIVCLGLNYADHAAEGGHKKPEYPSFFLRVPSSLAAHGEALLRPRVSDRFDFEAELAVIIGKPGRHLDAQNALDVVAGYTCFNDGSLRDYQRKTTQWTIGKNFDRTGPLGPWVVPASELPPGATGLKIESRLNGQVMQSSNTSNMLSPVVETLCLLTEVMTLEPGDVIAMGTPSGVGYARNPPVFMKAGDRIEIEIEKIGVLANSIVDEE
ncbi:fumarylacetoacetate hydrolase family protein [Ramlibacter alkalitolerans]|uniref:Fumarylacetoacetate hydrolase family protein n=1 Tax=Ramlibacter alkalitolerans TaxID=2039631 RepID=A0ABS1JQZ4_9BURK|nr:fumarylacetoacetate hydrolase family protein [Ramlibacter alkalitolerans]MBL0426566.1 fumarylacetoacetate hydrolase family protein [Ramlibacter alkalitolerans]